MVQTVIAEGTRRLWVRIPEGRHVEGLDYGAHVSFEGGAGYYVRPEGAHDLPWGTARLTPAEDELSGDGTDADIVAAIREELRTPEDDN